MITNGTDKPHPINPDELAISLSTVSGWIDGDAFIRDDIWLYPTVAGLS